MFTIKVVVLVWSVMVNGVAESTDRYTMPDMETCLATIKGAMYMNNIPRKPYALSCVYEITIIPEKKQLSIFN